MPVLQKTISPLKRLPVNDKTPPNERLQLKSPVGKTAVAQREEYLEKKLNERKTMIKISANLFSRSFPICTVSNT